MVANVTSLTGNGLRDWWIQRVSAVYFLLYSIFFLGFMAKHNPLTFESWHQFFQCRCVRVATVLAVLAFTLHAWIGIWTVLTDYVKCFYIRFSLQIVVLFLLMGQFIYALMIIWGQ